MTIQSIVNTTVDIIDWVPSEAGTVNFRGNLALLARKHRTLFPARC
jgi:hypothetical protein